MPKAKFPRVTIVPKTGTQFEIDGQLYTVHEVDRYMAHLTAPCWNCGAPFDLFPPLPIQIVPKEFSRRCSACANPKSKARGQFMKKGDAHA